MDKIEAVLGRDQYGNVRVEHWREEIELQGIPIIAREPTFNKGHRLYESTRDFMYQHNLQKLEVAA